MQSGKRFRQSRKAGASGFPPSDCLLSCRLVGSPYCCNLDRAMKPRMRMLLIGLAAVVWSAGALGQQSGNREHS